MSTDINETVEARTDRLMADLALHPDKRVRAAVADALYDMFDAGRDSAEPDTAPAAPHGDHDGEQR